MALNAAQAESIINEYKAGYEDDTPMPETDEEKIKYAEYLVKEARRMQDAGVRDNTIAAILFFGEDPSAVSETYPRRSSGGLSESDERETDFNPDYRSPTPGFQLTMRENLPVPPHIEGDVEQMPRDISSISDKEIRRLSGEYNAYLGRVTYLLGVEMSDLINAQHLLEAAKAKVLRTMEREKKLAKVIDAEILADAEVSEMTGNVASHEQSVSILKSLKEIYSGNVDRLSREWTMRQNEWEKSR